MPGRSSIAGHRLMAAGIVVSVVASLLVLIAAGAVAGTKVLIALLLLSCLISCVAVWLIAEHDAVVVDHEIKALRDRIARDRRCSG